MKSNMARILSLGVLAILLHIGVCAKASVDSVGVQRQNGEICVLHQVKGGETLFAIGKQYGVSLDDLLKFNPFIVGNTIGVGQIIFIPRYGRAAQIETKRKERELKEAAKMPAVATHQIQTGETLYALSRKYGVSVEDLRKANPALSIDDIPVGSTLKIPASGDQPVKVREIPSRTSPDVTKRHIVEQGETLYAIARKYPGSSVEAITRANKLDGASIKIGQELIVPIQELSSTVLAQGTTSEVVPEKKPDVEPVAAAPTAVDPTAEVALKTDTIAAPVVTVSNPVKQKNFETYSDYQGAGKQFRRERGVATWLNENTDASAASNYFALHNQAPIGSIVKVKNLMNNKVVFAKVIGRLPENKQDKRSLVKLSYNAADELGALDARFLVEIESVSN